MPRVLVIVPNDSYRVADFAAAAEALSVDLAIASEERPPLRPDDRFVEVDCADPVGSADAIVDLASRSPIDAVVSADDAGVEIAALASAALGLPASPPSAARATIDKASARRLLGAAEIPQPEYRLLGPEDDPAGAMADIGQAVVVKPTMLSAGRGVIRVDTPDAAAAAVDRIRAIVRAAGRDESAPLLVERYVDGPEISVEGIVWGGEVEILAVLDKPEPMSGPYFEETIFVTPSRHPEAVLAEVERVTASAVHALGLTEGPIHAELRIDAGRPMIIEVAGRTIGGLCGRALRFGLLGAPLETVVLRHALGMRKESMRRERSASGVLMIPIPAAGTLRSVVGIDEVRSHPGVTSVEITAPIGTEVAPPPDGDRYLGFVFARADDPATVEETLRWAMATIEVGVG
jgi:biotin carboxylase